MSRRFFPLVIPVKKFTEIGTAVRPYLPLCCISSSYSFLLPLLWHSLHFLSSALSAVSEKSIVVRKICGSTLFPISIWLWTTSALGTVQLWQPAFSKMNDFKAEQPCTGNVSISIFNQVLSTSSILIRGRIKTRVDKPSVQPSNYLVSLSVPPQFYYKFATLGTFNLTQDRKELHMVVNRGKNLYPIS